ncbi:DEAD/DEAH box helicase [Desulfobacter sp. UBA2225]|uniref:DEAD/DEAH box helicase n=1 Tax=Desulfobacter sp. UBA2225 TaxID=1961413 RepID=UPI00257D5CB9|nr:SNF2-related protein [Desulfobacter sp. UBA2225]
MLAKSKAEKRKQKRKQKQVQVRLAKAGKAAADKGWFYYEEALYYDEIADPSQALKSIKNAVKLLPKEEVVIHLMGRIGHELGDAQVQLDAMDCLEKIGKMTDSMRYERVIFLINSGKYELCLKSAEDLLQNFTQLKIDEKRRKRAALKDIMTYCKDVIAQAREREETTRRMAASYKRQDGLAEAGAKHMTDMADPPPPTPEPSTVPPVDSKASEKPASVPVTVNIDKDAFVKALAVTEPAGPDLYELALMSHKIRFAESFETLICLPGLTEIQSFWYQEETAKKVLKQFRGRALLSDEVGLGKTIEALIILSEYLRRGMVKTALILTPTPLVSQWQTEMASKFNLNVSSTDSPEFKSGDNNFWEQKVVVASINQAKSKKNWDLITSREYDMVIVDEAHHLKNKSTLNFKLVNALKKKFILLLTATPVENNLMELYNLITLLKPGQLETATSFRERFMKRGDPTDPQNREMLKNLLSQVMIRNTRALAGIHIPPRFATTIRIAPTKDEAAFYERLQTLLHLLNNQNKGRSKLMIKNLLAQAGSSPKAVEATLERMIDNGSWLLETEKEIKAVRNLCRTTVDTPKNMALLKLVKADSEKLIVFVKYTATLEHLAEFLEWNNVSFVLFHGGMSNEKKDAAIEAFKENVQVLVTTEIGGEGRNIQFCSRMVNYDLPWNPMKIEQRIGRIHRIGQEKEVQIYNFCAQGSIEDYILDILDRKINMFEMVIGEIDMILGRVTGEKEFSDMVCDIWVESQTPEERDQSFAKLGTKLKRAKTGYVKTKELDGKLFGDSYEL